MPLRCRAWTELIDSLMEHTRHRRQLIRPSRLTTHGISIDHKVSWPMRLLKSTTRERLKWTWQSGNSVLDKNKTTFSAHCAMFIPTEQLFSNGRLEVRQLADSAGRDLPQNNNNASSVHCAMLVAEGAVVYFVAGPKRGSI